MNFDEDMSDNRGNQGIVKTTNEMEQQRTDGI